MRMNVDTNYIQNLVTLNWGEGPKINAGSLAKLLQDHYRMLTADTSSEFDVSIKTLFEMTKFLRGPRVGDVDGDRTRWALWREVDQYNIFVTLHNLLFSFLYNSDELSAEKDLLNEYMNYMYSLVDFVDQYYPDKYFEINNPTEPVYDISKARMTEFVLSMAMRYANASTRIFENANDLGLLTVNGIWEFLDQSPDTRPTTFKAAVIYESDADDQPVINYLVQEINNDAVF